MDEVVKVGMADLKAIAGSGILTTLIRLLRRYSAL